MGPLPNGRTSWLIIGDYEPLTKWDDPPSSYLLYIGDEILASYIGILFYHEFTIPMNQSLCWECWSSGEFSVGE